MWSATTRELRARSLSRTVAGCLAAPAFSGHVLAVFERACILSPDGAEPFGLVLPAKAPGPEAEWTGAKHHLVVEAALAEEGLRDPVARLAGKKHRDAEPLQVRFEEADHQRDGSQANGRLVFVAADPRIAEGRYEITYHAIIDGAKLQGYRRASIDGVPILVKSSKFHAELTGE